MPEYLIAYECPKCGHEWHEVYSCACDSECPSCGCGDIQAADYELLSSDTEEEGS
jgi:predicted Zn-ribbon and HTH transcriptional regulator